MKELDIPTWKTELDALRGNSRLIKLTKEQLEIVHYSRTGKEPLSWHKIKDFIDKKYGTISLEVIKREYNKYKGEI